MISRMPLLANSSVNVLLTPANTSDIFCIFSLNLSEFFAVAFCCSSPDLTASLFTLPKLPKAAAVVLNPSSAAAAVLIRFKAAGPSSRPILRV